MPGLHGDLVNAMLTYREHRYSEALRLLDQYIQTPSSRLGSRFVKDPVQQAINLALRAMLCAELERADEARRDLAQSLAQLKVALGDKPGHDRGDNWYLVDQAEIHQREAKALFEAKGIPLPEPDAK